LPHGLKDMQIEMRLNQKGQQELDFTLIEVMVVIAIIGILVAVVVDHIARV